MPFFPEGFTDGHSSHHKRSSSHHRSSKRHRSRSSSRTRSHGHGAGSVISDFFTGKDSSYNKHNASRSALGDFFTGKDSSYNKHNASRSALGDFFTGKDSSYNKHNASRSSFFGVPLGNSSRGSFFGLGSRPSYYKRSPRKGFMQRAYKQLKRLIRDLLHWFKRHPWKVFFMVIMPLVTGGALTALLARFGLRIPPSLERAMGMASRAASGDSMGFVGDAMRMAGGATGASRGASHSARASFDSYTHSRGRSSRDGDDWSSGLMNGVAKMFI